LLRLRTTNMQERSNQEVRRREQGIRIFPHEAFALRMIGILLAEQNEVRQERRHLDMDDYHAWKAAAERVKTRPLAIAG